MRLELSGETVELRADRTAFWPAARTLLAADLHWGKPETFQFHSVGVPSGLLEDELGRLSCALEETRAERLLLLGDLVHAREGLGEAVMERVRKWRSSFGGSVWLVIGNHDRRAVSRLKDLDLELLEPGTREGPFRWHHDPEAAGDGFLWAGHWHPTVKIGSRADRLRLPCFVVEPGRLILPAFSTFTSGIVVPPATGRRRVVIADDRLHALDDR